MNSFFLFYEKINNWNYSCHLRIFFRMVFIIYLSMEDLHFSWYLDSQKSKLGPMEVVHMTQVWQTAEMHSTEVWLQQFILNTKSSSTNRFVVIFYWMDNKCAMFTVEGQIHILCLEPIDKFMHNLYINDICTKPTFLDRVHKHVYINTGTSTF